MKRSKMIKQMDFKEIRLGHKRKLSSTSEAEGIRLHKLPCRDLRELACWASWWESKLYYSLSEHGAFKFGSYGSRTVSKSVSITWLCWFSIQNWVTDVLANLIDSDWPVLRYKGFVVANRLLVICRDAVAAERLESEFHWWRYHQSFQKRGVGSQTPWGGSCFSEAESCWTDSSDWFSGWTDEGPINKKRCFQKIETTCLWGRWAGRFDSDRVGKFAHCSRIRQRCKMPVTWFNMTRYQKGLTRELRHG